MISLHDLVKVYELEGQSFKALDGITLDVQAGEYVAIMGASGSGKSTLMNIIGCLDRPTSGSYLLDGVQVETLSDRELTHIRNQKIGFVFQQFNLLPRLSALENVELPMVYARMAPKERRERAIASLEKVGLSDRLYHRPTQLSGGQQQRVAIARALANNPSLLLADEPTGALDSKTSGEIMQLFDELNTQGVSLVLITHEQDVAAHAHRLIRLRDGQVTSDERMGATLSEVKR